jgi:hypothetical protein
MDLLGICLSKLLFPTMKKLISFQRYRSYFLSRSHNSVVFFCIFIHFRFVILSLLADLIGWKVAIRELGIQYKPGVDNIGNIKNK